MNALVGAQIEARRVRQLASPLSYCRKVAPSRNGIQGSQAQDRAKTSIGIGSGLLQAPPAADAASSRDAQGQPGSISPACRRRRARH